MNKPNLTKDNNKKTSARRATLFSTTGILIFVVLVGLFSSVANVQARTFNPNVDCKNYIVGTPDYVNCANAVRAEPDQTNGGVQSAVATTNTEGDSSGWFSWLQPSKWLASALSWVAFLIMKIMSLLLELSGLLLNFTIKTTIIDMAKNVSVSGMTGINTAWKVIRDLMNIAFIFLLVYEGILMIIGQSDTNKVKKFITGIVLASLLINFSLFFTKVMIDASNIVTIGLYNSILTDTNSTENSSGLSNAYMQSLGLQGFFSTKAIDVGANADYYSSLTANMMASILLLVTSFVFLAVSILFIVRYITLLLLLVLSPIAYMGMALPFTKKRADEWWDSLWGQLLFAPIYMLMTWVVLTLITSGNFTGAATLDPANFAKSGTDIGGSINLFFNFAVIIGMTIASLVISKKYATQGSSLIGQLTGQATKFAGGALLGGAALTARNTLGRGGNALGNSEKMKDWAVSDKGWQRFVGKQILKTGDKVAGSSFDARATNIGKTLSGASGIDFGKGADKKKVNFRKELEAKETKEVDFAKTLKLSGDEEDRIRRGMVGRSDKEIDAEIKKQHKLRVDKYAGQFQNTKLTKDNIPEAYGEEFKKGPFAMAWRYTKNVLKIATPYVATGVPLMAGGPTTRGDNRAIARAIIKKGTKSTGKLTEEERKALAKLARGDESEDETTPPVPPTP